MRVDTAASGARAERVPSRKERIDAEAWRLHRANGHPEGYDGPCWGPTEDEKQQAKETVDG